MWPLPSVLLAERRQRWKRDLICQEGGKLRPRMDLRSPIEMSTYAYDFEMLAISIQSAAGGRSGGRLAIPKRREARPAVCGKACRRGARRGARLIQPGMSCR